MQYQVTHEVKPKIGSLAAVGQVLVRIRLPYEPTSRVFTVLDALCTVLDRPLTYDKFHGRYVVLSATLPSFSDILSAVIPMLNRLRVLDVAEVTAESDAWDEPRIVHPADQ